MFSILMRSARTALFKAAKVGATGCKPKAIGSTEISPITVP